MACLDLAPTLRLVYRIRQNVRATSDIESASSDPNRLYNGKSEKSHVAGLPHDLFNSNHSMLRFLALLQNFNFQNFTREKFEKMKSLVKSTDHLK